MDHVHIDDFLRLKPFAPNDVDVALIWYTDPVVLSGAISPGRAQPCSREMIIAMYNDLSLNSDLFIIEVRENSNWRPIGDATLAKNRMPIVIGDKNYRGKGLAKKVLLKLLEIARQRGFSEISLNEIYRDNFASIKLFEGVGFKRVAETKKGISYKLML